MPPQTTLDTKDKDKIKNAIPTNKIHYAALAKIYYAYPDTGEWSYAGLQGALAFVVDTTNNKLYFRMVDLDGPGEVIWEYELYSGFVLNKDRDFFLSYEDAVSFWLSTCLSSNPLLIEP